MSDPVAQIQIDELKKEAQSLHNGNTGCIETMGRVVAKTALILAAREELGYVTPAKCQQMHEELRNAKRQRWDVVTAFLGTLLMFAPLLYMILTK